MARVQHLLLLLPAVASVAVTIGGRPVLPMEVPFRAGELTEDGLPCDPEGGDLGPWYYEDTRDDVQVPIRVLQPIIHITVIIEVVQPSYSDYGSLPLDLQVAMQQKTAYKGADEYDPVDLLLGLAESAVLDQQQQQSWTAADEEEAEEAEAEEAEERQALLLPGPVPPAPPPSPPGPTYPPTLPKCKKDLQHRTSLPNGRPIGTRPLKREGKPKKPFNPPRPPIPPGPPPPPPSPPSPPSPFPPPPRPFPPPPYPPRPSPPPPGPPPPRPPSPRKVKDKGPAPDGKPLPKQDRASNFLDDAAGQLDNAANWLDDKLGQVVPFLRSIWEKRPDTAAAADGPDAATPSKLP